MQNLLHWTQTEGKAHRRRVGMGMACIGISVALLYFWAFQTGRGRVPGDLAILWWTGLATPWIALVIGHFGARCGTSKGDLVRALNICMVIAGYVLFFSVYGSGIEPFAAGLRSSRKVDLEALQKWAATATNYDVLTVVKSQDLPRNVRDIWTGAKVQALSYEDHVLLSFTRGFACLKLCVGGPEYTPDGPPVRGILVQWKPGIYALCSSRSPIDSMR